MISFDIFCGSHYIVGLADKTEGALKVWDKLFDRQSSQFIMAAASRAPFQAREEKRGRDRRVTQWRHGQEKVKQYHNNSLCH